VRAKAFFGCLMDSCTILEIRRVPVVSMDTAGWVRDDGTFDCIAILSGFWCLWFGVFSSLFFWPLVLMWWFSISDRGTIYWSAITVRTFLTIWWCRDMRGSNLNGVRPSIIAFLRRITTSHTTLPNPTRPLDCTEIAFILARFVG
jgi:hypothetical protein